MPARWRFRLSFVVPLPAPASWAYILASIATHLAYYFFMVSAYRSGELTLVYPLMRGVAPLLTGVLAIVWMREWPGAAGWIGMLLISVGGHRAGVTPGSDLGPRCTVTAAQSASRWPTR